MRALAATLALLLAAPAALAQAPPPAPTPAPAAETREDVARAVLDAIQRRDAAAFQARCTPRFLALMPMPVEQLVGQIADAMQRDGLPPLEDVARDLHRQPDGSWKLDLPEGAEEGLKEARQHGEEAAAIGALRTLVTAQALFREGDKDGNGQLDYAADLAALGATKLIDEVLASGTKQGYRFRVVRAADAPEFRWMATAAPVSSEGGGRSFVVNHEGQVHEGAAPFECTADCAIPPGARPLGAGGLADHEPDLSVPEPAPGAPEDLLAGVEVGQRWVFAMSADMEMVWTVTAVEKVGRVRYTMTVVLGGNALGEPQPSEWVYTGPAVLPPPEAQTPDVSIAREAYEVAGRKLEALVTKVGETASWVAVRGEHPTFPGVLKTSMGDEVPMRLVRIEGP